MIESTWIAVTGLALGAGAVLGAWLGRRAPLRDLVARGRRADKELQEQQARAAEALRAVQAKATKDLEEARAQRRGGSSTAETATTAQRAEIEKLTRHLTEAYDELDQLRVKVRTSGQPQVPDTGHGFAATMPLGDL